MLEVSSIAASYGRSQVLFGIDMNIQAGEAIGLLGRNGMGKSTTIKAIMGVVAMGSGYASFEGTPLGALPAYRVAQLGVGWVPEGRHVFPNLTVLENLVCVSANRHHRSPAWTPERVLQEFPGLARRVHSVGRQLSGGEQQMLAIGRALCTNPKLLILDEATEGLAPLVREDIWRVLRKLKDAGQSILVVDKHVDILAGIADRHYILEKGKVAWHGTSAELKRDKSIRLRYLGV